MEGFKLSTSCNPIAVPQVFVFSTRLGSPCIIYSDNSKVYSSSAISEQKISKETTRKLSRPSWRRTIYESKNEKLLLSVFYLDSLKNFTWNELFGNKKWVKQYKKCFK